MRLSRCLLLLLCASPGLAQEIVVHFNPRPPYHVLSAGQLSGLTGEPIRRALARAEITYVLQETPAARQLVMARENQGAHCFVGWYKTRERERYARFSQPVYRDQPNIVLFAADNPRTNEITSLKQLLAAPDLVLLSKKSYSYGPELDALLAQIRPVRQAVTVENLQMLKMLHARRADYMFMAPEELEPLLVAAQLARDDFVARRLPDMPQGETRHLMCTRAVDPQLIERFDAALE